MTLFSIWDKGMAELLLEVCYEIPSVSKWTKGRNFKTIAACFEARGGLWPRKCFPSVRHHHASPPCAMETGTKEFAGHG